MRETAIASFVFVSLSRQPRSKKIKFTSVSGNLRKVPFQSSVRGLSREVTARRPAGCVGAVFLGTSRHETARTRAAIMRGYLNLEPLAKAGPDGNHGFLLRRAVRIRQSAWGVAPRHSTHRAVSLTILAVIKLTPSRCGSRRSIAADVKKLGGPARGDCPRRCFLKN